MNKLNIELTNCFGIDSLKHEFDFGKGNTFSIYARNGLMKTSFAKTFQLIQQGKKENISDAIFGEPGSAIVQIDAVTGRISNTIPDINSSLRIEKYAQRIEEVYTSRYKGLPPHN